MRALKRRVDIRNASPRYVKKEKVVLIVRVSGVSECGAGLLGPSGIKLRRQDALLALPVGKRPKVVHSLFLDVC